VKKKRRLNQVNGQDRQEIRQKSTLQEKLPKGPFTQREKDRTSTRAIQAGSMNFQARSTPKKDGKIERFRKGESFTGSGVEFPT